jgi:hypothetical protein
MGVLFTFGRKTKYSTLCYIMFSEKVYSFPQISLRHGKKKHPFQSYKWSTHRTHIPEAPELVLSLTPIAVLSDKLVRVLVLRRSHMPQSEKAVKAIVDVPLPAFHLNIGSKRRRKLLDATCCCVSRSRGLTCWWIGWWVCMCDAFNN